MQSFKDGSEVAGESHIADHPGMIDHVYVTNTLDDETPQASRRVVNTILESDMIVLGAWFSLYIDFAQYCHRGDWAGSLGDQGGDRLCLQYHDPAWGNRALFRQ